MLWRCSVKRLYSSCLSLSPGKRPLQVSAARRRDLLHRAWSPPELLLINSPDRSSAIELPPAGVLPRGLSPTERWHPVGPSPFATKLTCCPLERMSFGVCVCSGAPTTKSISLARRSTRQFP